MVFGFKFYQYRRVCRRAFGGGFCIPDCLFWRIHADGTSFADWNRSQFFAVRSDFFFDDAAQRTAGKNLYVDAGEFRGGKLGKGGFLAVFVALFGTVLAVMGKELDLLAAGEDTARTLGVSVKQTRYIIIFAGTFLVAACVSVSGIIGFVGLVVPHCIRLIFGAGHRRLLVYSMLGGAIFLVFCDTIARTAAAPTEIPVGVITAVFGAPYFLFLLHKSKKGTGL